MKDLAHLAAAGCRFVRLARSEKRPLGAAWQTKSTGDIEQAQQWLRSGSNVGLLLGPVSGVIDVEFDTPGGREQLAALGLLDIPTPTWRSARGEHRLFRWADWLPAAAVVHVDEIEVRIGGRAAQSVLPPSRHPSGSVYEWLVRPCDVPVAAFPACLLEAMQCAA